jgi:hypothetical protein
LVNYVHCTFLFLKPSSLRNLTPILTLPFIHRECHPPHSRRRHHPRYAYLRARVSPSFSISTIKGKSKTSDFTSKLVYLGFEAPDLERKSAHQGELVKLCEDLSLGRTGLYVIGEIRFVLVFSGLFSSK